MKTIIETEIQGDQWTATTPNAPYLSGKGGTEAASVDQLVRAIREAIQDAGDSGVEWHTDAKPTKDSGKITRQLSGCWPPIIKALPERKELDYAD